MRSGLRSFTSLLATSDIGIGQIVKSFYLVERQVRAACLPESDIVPIAEESRGKQGPFMFDVS